MMKVFCIGIVVVLGLASQVCAKPKQAAGKAVSNRLVQLPALKIPKKEKEVSCLLGKIVLSDDRSVFAFRFVFTDFEGRQGKIECADHAQFESPVCPRNKIVSVEIPRYGLDGAPGDREELGEMFFFPPLVTSIQTVSVRFICIDPPVDGCIGEDFDMFARH